jgi:hypothetical protein
VIVRINTNNFTGCEKEIRHDAAADDDNKRNYDEYNSIPFLFVTCKLNSQEANYKVNTSKKKTTKHLQTKDKSR